MNMESLYGRFLKLEHFLKHSEPFTSQCIGLKHKTDFIADQYESIATLIKQLEQLKLKQQYASVEVMMDVQEKTAELQKLKIGHNKVLIEAEQQSEEVESLLAVYNDLVEKLSGELIAYNNLVNAR